VVLPSQDLQDFQDQNQNPATHATGSWCYVLCAAGGTPCVYTKDARHIFFQHEHKLCFSNIYFQTFKPSKARKGRIKSKFTKNLILFFKQQQQAHTNTHTHTSHLRRNPWRGKAVAVAVPFPPRCVACTKLSSLLFVTYMTSQLCSCFLAALPQPLFPLPFLPFALNGDASGNGNGISCCRLLVHT